MNAQSPRLGLHQNLGQFLTLVLVNAFVGGLIGLERTVLPLVAHQEFGIASASAILAFIATFGAVKAFANLFAGHLSDRIGRKRVLLAGWLVGIPAPLLIVAAPSWSWIVLANVLLGVNQGLCWSTTVMMKIDLVGPQRRGLAMGFNEASGYLAVSAAALASGYFATAGSLRLLPGVAGAGLAIVGLLISWLCVHDTTPHMKVEAAASGSGHPPVPFSSVFAETSWKNPSLFSATQAGFANNLNDGVAWGLFPLLFATQGLSLREIGVLTAVYPAVWGCAQLVTGHLSDTLGRRGLIVGGMLVQATAIASVALVSSFGWWLAAAIGLGLGTAMVYPTLIVVVSDVARPDWRATAVGVYRLWRDLGYVAGAILAGIIADLVGLRSAVFAVASLTAASGLAAAFYMQETVPRRVPDVSHAGISR